MMQFSNAPVGMLLLCVTDTDKKFVSCKATLCLSIGYKSSTFKRKYCVGTLCKFSSDGYLFAYWAVNHGDQHQCGLQHSGIRERDTIVWLEQETFRWYCLIL